MTILRSTHAKVGWSLLLALALAGCASRSQPEASGGPAVDIDSLPRLTITVVRRFGSEESPDTGFTFVGGVDVGRDGSVYALDERDYRIRVYDPNGRLVRLIGGQGPGPGEFDSPPLFGVVGDTVWTYDRNNGRLTLFSRKGEGMSTAQLTRVEVPAPGFPSWKAYLGPVLMRPDGRLLSSVQGWVGVGGPPPRGLPDTLLNPEVEWDASGSVVDTVAWYFAPDLPKRSGRNFVIRGELYTVPAPPSDRPLRLLLPSGQIVVDRFLATSGSVGSFSITRSSFSGDTMYHRVFRYRPVRYPPSLMDTLVAKASWPSALPQGAKAVRSAEAERRIRARMRFPTYQPPIQGALVGASGSVWLRREDRAEATYTWVVLGPDGSARGLVELPRSVRLAWAGGDRIITVSTDSAGVPWLVEYRLGGSE